MDNNTCVDYPYSEERRERIISVHCVSWGAILAGVFATLAVATVLNLLGLGLDLVAFSPDKERIEDLGVISIIWIVLSSMSAMLAGSWLAGRMAGPGFAGEGALHGLATWSVTTVVTFLLVATSVGAAIGLMANTLSQSYAYAEQSQPKLIEPEMPSQLQDFFAANNPTDEAAAKGNLINFLEQNQGMQPAQAEQTVASLQDTKDRAHRNAEKASRGLGTLILIIFMTFLLTAITSAFGGMWGAYSDRKLFVREVKVRKI